MLACRLLHIKLNNEMLSDANVKITAIIGRLFLIYADNHFIFFVVQEFWFPIPGRTGVAHGRSSTFSSNRVTLGYAYGDFNYCT
jgi:hypothetical protein